MRGRDAFLMRKGAMVRLSLVAVFQNDRANDPPDDANPELKQTPHNHQTPLSLIMTRFTAFFWTTILIFGSSAASIKIGDECGVDGRDFLDDAFTGEYRVSGAPGCSIEGGTDCYCAPNYGSTVPVGQWVWGCNSVDPSEVPFGPNEGKVCPSEIPVPVGYNEDGNPPCDNTNPTGQAGDPPCAYSDCDQGGNFSAVCGCVDLSFGEGEDEPGDRQWFCLHATCHCGDETTSSSVSVFGMLSLILAVATMVFHLS